MSYVLWPKRALVTLRDRASTPEVRFETYSKQSWINFFFLSLCPRNFSHAFKQFASQTFCMFTDYVLLREAREACTRGAGGITGGKLISRKPTHSRSFSSQAIIY